MDASIWCPLCSRAGIYPSFSSIWFSLLIYLSVNLPTFLTQFWNRKFYRLSKPIFWMNLSRINVLELI
uniref:Uncharacterized protein n=1 Tax=Oryza glaberrima TaxID=4538 RepID=I1QY01_ORYGL